MIEDILTQIGSTTIVIAIAAYVAKTWVKHQMEKISTQNSHELARQIAKLNVHEPYLHKRRVEVIEAIYAKTLDAEFSLQNFLVTWWGHSNREELTARAFPEGKVFSNNRGLEFCEAFTEINAMLHKNALYFDDQFIEGVLNVYKPFFDEILNMDETNPPPFPNEYIDIIEIGQKPRQSVISLFRRALGVEGEA
ncbi:hypothetical protein [Marinobacterium sedimentorum]|uniref:hypothetical protein n=1 Tax=Marinobacterium sedimentorum TaxID=2927804 RepID=UPI0020C739C6|nr:hypothetical protein [Marinobacterium sedimentorum]MCP8687771.1 hypothetical protein [Marinobacterium sedimentorum]